MEKEINEKRLLKILLSIAAIAIIAVILIYIPWGGEKATFRKEFNIEDKEHVFDEIEFDKLEKMINQEKEFQVFLGSPKDEESSQFVYEANELAKEYDVEVIYYVNSDDLTEENRNYLLGYFSDVMEFPTLAYFSSNDGEYMLYPASSWKDYKNDYASNWYKLLKEYFEQCYS